MRSITRIPLLALVAALLVTLAGCGSDDDSGGNAATTTAATSTATAGAFPVTIENALGTVEIEQAPERVVALDFPSADAALALGVRPVAIARVDYADDGIQPWTKEALGGERPKLLTTSTGYPVEQVAAERPDLILATNAYGIGDVYDELRQIAPVVTFETGEGEDSWQQSTERIGRALGRAQEAADLIAETERQVADARRANPDFEGKEIAFFNAVDRTAWAINRHEDFSIKFLADLGFVLSPQIARLRGTEGRAQISAERYELLDADVVIGTSPSPAELRALAANPLFERLPAVRAGRYVELPLSPATSMAFPSALSVQYGLREIVPLLEQAAR
ncbi:iron-siderophore ABC transporter substrate-binding protein [Conexibacter arvalis]|uniref:Iron complex transport system substrate-binding protein n=1 Tax=Conexibacter arvalis TaxID=912552 RepID=A0A840I7F0_9ACTN|nr:iron-siderophore ABC transporter substrate-binding protein [Conexibacter arvalis]MBB4660787.1 iron complex transport system substrate-binding protein [Conexibacter arvalis]